jgi:small-conductance mechanosensitive channel
MQMKNVVFRLQRIGLVLLVAVMALGGTTSCKSKKKLAREQAAAEYAAKVDQAKKDLNAILYDETSWTLDEKEKRFNTIKSWNLQDEEVLNLLDQVEDKLARDRADAQRKAEEERLRREEEARLQKEAAKYSNIENQFMAIAGAPDVMTANEKISRALSLFASPDVPVLIIISQAGGFNDYDRPTTIQKYLNYLKDQKSYNNAIEQVKYDGNGKITELELIKK